MAATHFHKGLLCLFMSYGEMKHILEERENELRAEKPDTVFPAYELVGAEAARALLEKLYARCCPGHVYSWNNLEHFVFTFTESKPVYPSFVVDSPAFHMESLFRSLGLQERVGLIMWVPDHEADLQVYRVNFVELGNVLPDLWHPDDDIVFFPQSLSWLLFCWHYDGFFSFRTLTSE